MSNIVLIGAICAKKPRVSWNPGDADDVILTNGDLTATGGSGAVTSKQVRANVSKSSGLFYYEAVLVSGPVSSFPYIGIRPSGNALGGNGPADPGGDAGCFAQSPNLGHETYHAGANLGGIGPALATSDVFMVAVNLTSHIIWIGRNGTFDTLFGTPGDPAAGVGGATIATGSWSPWCAVAGTSITARFSAASWSFGAPSGFSEWTA